MVGAEMGFWVKVPKIIKRPPKPYYLIPAMEGTILTRLGEEKIHVDDPEFQKFVTDQVQIFMATGKSANPSIEATVGNLAEDYLAGREMNIRTGDYIVMRSFQRELMGKK